MTTEQPTELNQPFTYSEDYDSADADIELISSDQMVFKVHMYRLQYHSTVFQNMVSVATAFSERNRIHLTDPALEHSEVIKRILDIIYTLDIGIYQSHERNTLRLVVEFAKKWEMSMIIKLIRNDMARGLDSKTTKPKLFDSFLLALRLGDNDLAASYFGSKNRQIWPTPHVKPVKQRLSVAIHSDSDDSEEDSDDSSDEEEDSEFDTDVEMAKAAKLKESSMKQLPDSYLNDQPASGLLADHYQASIKNGDVFDLSTIPYSEFLHIPSNVIWIILRAQRLVKGDSRKVEQYLRDMLNVAYPPFDNAGPSKKRKAGD